MPTTLTSVVANFLRTNRQSKGTHAEYHTTLRKWDEWGQSVSIEELDRKHIRDFLNWVYNRAVEENGKNPGRTANKSREQLRAVLAWAWDQELIEALPKFPKRKEQRDVAGRHYLTKAEINSLYFATHQMAQPRGWRNSLSVGTYWRSALVLFFNYGVDTGTIWGTKQKHEPLLWRHVSWNAQSPDSQANEQSRWGWLFYRRVKTGKSFYRPMNRVVHVHLKKLQAANVEPDSPVFLGGGSRPNLCFQRLCKLAQLREKQDFESGTTSPWLLKDLRKTCATYYDQHVPESSIEILGHTVGGITYRHYAHRTPLAFKAIMTLPQPSAFTALVRGYEDQCPCCRRPFDRSDQAM